MPPKPAACVYLVAAGLAACAGPQIHAEDAAQAPMRAFPESSTSAASPGSEVRSVYGEHGYAGKGHVQVNVGGVEQVTGLAVRPDVLRVAFRYQAIGADPNTLHLLHARLDELTAHAASATHEPAAVLFRRVRLEEQFVDQVLVRLVAVDGALDVTLPASLDEWGRAETLIVVNALIHGVMKELEPPPGATGPAPVQAAFQQPVATVREPEQYRAELVRRWVDRAHTFTKGASSAAAPLEILDCSVPGDVQVVPRALDEASVTLGIQCSLDALAHDAHQAHARLGTRPASIRDAEPE